MNLHPKIAMPMFISFLPFRPKNTQKKNTNTTGATLPLERKVCVSDPQLSPKKEVHKQFGSSFGWASKVTGNT